jgi:hypothetical protein
MLSSSVLLESPEIIAVRDPDVVSSSDIRRCRKNIHRIRITVDSIAEGDRSPLLLDDGSGHRRRAEKEILTGVGNERSLRAPSADEFLGTSPLIEKRNEVEKKFDTQVKLTKVRPPFRGKLLKADRGTRKAKRSRKKV